MWYFKSFTIFLSRFKHVYEELVEPANCFQILRNRFKHDFFTRICKNSIEAFLQKRDLNDAYWSGFRKFDIKVNIPRALI